MNLSGGLLEEQQKYLVNFHNNNKQRSFIDGTSDELGTDSRRALALLNNHLSASPKILSNGDL